MDSPLAGKSVLITGASIGIGRETAYAFAKEGCHVFLTYYKDIAEGEEAGNECKRMGAKSVHVFQLDVTREASIQQLKKKILAKRKKIDILVNNAGVYIHKSLPEHTLKEIDNLVKVNLLGPLHITHAFLPHVKECIINIASEAGRQAYPRMPVYCATKFGVRGLTKGLALDHPELRIYAVNPDTTATRMTHFHGMPPSKVARVVVNAAKGKYPVKSGKDLNVIELV